MNGLMTWKNFPSIRFAALTILIAILAGVSGCGGAKKPLENVVVRDTVVITKERKLVDTLLLFKDTTIYQDRVKLKIEYRDNYVKVEADCPSDTIRIETIKIQTAKSRDKKMGWEGFAGWIVALLALLVIIRTILNKIL